MSAALIGFLAAFILIFARVPIGMALALVGMAGFGWLVGWPQGTIMLAHAARDASMSYGLAVIPLFVLMGNLLAGAGISADLYRAAQSLVGHRRGGLAEATIVSCGGFAAVSGSSVATVVTMGRVSLPSMREFGYSDQLATATVAAGATLGILIPPSVIMIIYGIMTETHIGKLYAAGLIPGALGILLYIFAIKWIVWRAPNAAPRVQKSSLSERLSALKGVWMIVALFTLVLGGIYGGLFTAAEAAGIGAFGAFILALIKGTLTVRSTYAIFLDTALTSAMMFALLFGATVFGEFLNFTGVHHAILDLVTAQGLPPAAVIAVIVVIYLVLGCLMETLSIVLLTVPLFFPVVTGLGYDPVWFGVLLVVLIEVGLITPPIGMNLFVLRGVVPDVPLAKIMKGILPFVAVDIARVALIVLFPILSLALPHLFFD
ncbi:MAG: C4-dicarboxylate ABC transporter permease [Confluentimicrobium sp.]|jgi:tripartite ATP-independent transporter DctM subunit|uniref:TRAP transporter large permease n=1 Tax=Actibacterium sp. TaxID=1872125 RepID=UPI000C362447|nr:TRAP transporter large permease [Actibacterium sp.]MBC56731.1 C4-dicarboxylate ABC transporter permease [Actibacterium sp.]|tara:strand:+ start:12480 stop:13775 length:1296 start_codon:yes stop_codon:yes gene_type:complete